MKADVGSKDGNGKAGNPDIQPGVTIRRLGTEVIADKGKILSPGAFEARGCSSGLHRVDFRNSRFGTHPMSRRRVAEIALRTFFRAIWGNPQAILGRSIGERTVSALRRGPHLHCGRTILLSLHLPYVFSTMLPKRDSCDDPLC